MTTPLLVTPSTMGDDEQLLMRNLITRGAKIQPNTPIVTKIDNGYSTITYIKKLKYFHPKIILQKFKCWMYFLVFFL